jgi:hypothetical protein
VAISYPRFINDFFGAMQVFLADIMNDKELKKRVESRIVNLLYVTPV